jgi:hypothetical protein
MYSAAVSSFKAFKGHFKLTKLCYKQPTLDLRLLLSCFLFE